MKSYKILIFILVVFALLGILGFVFPEKGLSVGSITFKFPSPSAVLASKDQQQVDIDANLAALKQQTDASKLQSVIDSLKFYRQYVKSNDARLYFPNDDYTYFDKLFAALADAKNSRQAIHITHYGDSQIEMDRISSYFRSELQKEFGGKGAGMVPPIQTIPSFTVSQRYEGAFGRAVIYGDTSQPRASHRRYGILANMAHLYGEGSITVLANKGARSFASTQTFERLVVLLANNSENFFATCSGQRRSISSSNKNVSRLVWNFDTPVSRATVSFSGSAEIYAISMEGKNGVTVDNVPMRGCSGTIFSRLDSAIYAQCMKNMNVRLVVLQYGGNMMPSIKGTKAIDSYMAKLARQIRYIKSCNPNAYVLFIGPSDMSKRVDGKMQTYPYLSELNQAIKQTANNNGAAYWDMFNVMGGENSMVAWVKHAPAWAGGDYTHFTEAGAREIGKTLSDAFLLHYQFYELRKRCPEDLIKRFMY